MYNSRLWSQDLFSVSDFKLAVEVILKTSFFLSKLTKKFIGFIIDIWKNYLSEVHYTWILRIRVKKFINIWVYIEASYNRQSCFIYLGGSKFNHIKLVIFIFEILIIFIFI